MPHLVERFLIHFASSAFFILGSWLLSRWGWRKLGWSVTTASQLLAFTIICAMPTALIPPLREAFDVAAGQPLLKAVTDYISWFSGAAVASFFLYTLNKGK